MKAPPLIRPLRRVLLFQPGAVRAGFSTSQSRRQGLTTDPTGQVEGALAPAVEADEPRLPRTVQALHLKPLRRECEYGVPTADLQLRSYHVRTLEFFCDFALRAAYYLDLAAFGPVPLPKITERWTVPRSNFIFKKSQENFERITRRRLIQIRDGHPEAVQAWLAFLRKHAIAGVGMKANVWEFGSLDVAKQMDQTAKDVTGIIDPKWQHLGESKTMGTVEKVEELLQSERYRATLGR